MSGDTKTERDSKPISPPLRTHTDTHRDTDTNNKVFPTWSKTFFEFRKSEESFKHELGLI